MLEQRNKFINNMNSNIAGHKKNFHSLLSKLGWTLQSITGAVKFDQNDEINHEEQNQKDCTNNEEVKTEDNIKDSESIDRNKSEEQNEGTSKDSDKLYNELLASLSFQPKVKKEKLSDTELLASLLETERNAKRRRISYRNKIHTKNKSHTEVLREVIREQMELLKCKEDESEDDKLRTSEKKDDNDEMIEVSVTDGNPHLAWQTVGVVVGDQQKERLEKHNYNQQFDSQISNDWLKTSDLQKHRHSRFNHKHSKNHNYRDKNSKDRSRKDHDRERSSKSHSSKHADRNYVRDKSPRHRLKRKHSKERRSVSHEDELKSRNKRKKRRSNN